MLNVFRSQSKLVKWTLATILTLVAVSMVVTLIPNVFSGQPVNPNDPVLVEVGDDAVTVNEVYQQLREYAQAGTPAESMAFMARQVVENLIDDKVMMQAAAELGVKPSEAELAAWIKEQMPFLWEGGRFNSAQYQQLVQQRFQLSVPQFEQNLLKDLTVELRLRNLVTDNIVMTEEDLKEAFADANEKSQIDYVQVAAAGFTEQVEVNEDALRSYFEGNKFRYQIPEKRTVKRLTYDPAMTPVDTEFSEAEIRRFYEQNRYRYETPERVMARHILFMTIDPDAASQEEAELSEEKVKEAETKAREVLEKVKAGGDFAALATEYSEDPGTKDNGGDLGWVYRGQMVPEFELATFSMEEGAISQDLVKTDYGFHIIKVEKKDEQFVKPLEEVEGEIIAELQAEQQEVQRMERLDRLVTALRNDPSRADEVAEEFGIDVVTYSNFDRQGPPPGLGSTPQFLGNIFSAQEGDVVTNQTEEGVMEIALVTEIVPSREPAFEEVRDRIERDYVQAQARELAQARAAEVAKAARETDLAQAASKFGLEVTTSEFFTRTEGVEGFAPGSALGDVAFDGEVGTIIGPVNTSQGFGVARVAAKQPADMTQYVEQKQAIRTQYLDAKREEAFNLFKANVRMRYEQEGRIKRYEDRISQVIQQIRRG